MLNPNIEFIEVNPTADLEDEQEKINKRLDELFRKGHLINSVTVDKFLVTVVYEK